MDATKKHTVIVKTTDDFCPNFDNDTVKVSAINMKVDKLKQYKEKQ